MDLTTIASSTLIALSPIIQKGLEKFAEKSAEEGFNERKIIWEKVKNLFKADDLTLLNLLEDAKSDEKKQSKLEGEIETLLEIDPNTAEELQSLLEKLSLTKSKETSINQIGNKNILLNEVINSKINIKN